MARKTYTAEQIIGMLREADVRLGQGEKVGAICRSLGVSEQSYYRWRREYGGLKVTQATRMRALEKENARLRKAVSNLTLDALILKEVIEGKF
jgi:putative transposase